MIPEATGNDRRGKFRFWSNATFIRAEILFKASNKSGKGTRMKVVLILAICFQIGEFDNINVVIDSTQRSWMDASTSGQCQMAGGTLTNGTSAGSVNFNVIGSDLPTSEAWIGATITYFSWIEFQGCRYGKEIGTSFRFDVTTSADPAQACTEKCEGSIFYLSSDWCYCPSGVTYSEVSCTVVTCPGDRPCGNQSVPFDMFTYQCMCKYEPVSVSSDNLIGECKTVVHDGAGSVVIQTTNCSETYSVMCLYSDGSKNIPGTASDTWIKSVEVCENHGGQIIGLDGASNALITEKQHWIGVFRGIYIHWKATDLSSPTYCLSATVSADGSLQTFVRLCTSLLTSLCETEVSTTTGQSTEPVSQDQTTPGSGSNSSTPPTTISMDTTVTSTTNKPVTAPFAETDRTGLIVGLVLAFVFGIVALCLVYYFVVKRKRKREQKDELDRLESLNRLPHSLRQAGRENKLSFIGSGNYNELNELSKTQPNKYDDMTSPDLYSYDKLDKGGRQAKQSGTGTYDTMANIHAQQDGSYSTITDLKRATASTPPTLTDTSMYDTMGGKK